jgi:tellurite resistance protein TehA-like permease
MIASNITSNVRTLFPGYFAMVMATGIIAVGSSQQGLDLLADALYLVAAATYVVLVVLLLWRLVIAPKLVAAEVTSHAKGFGFLTTVAATNVLGAASALIHGWWDLAWGFWWIGIGVWPVFVYATLIAVVITGSKPGLANGINGTWFLLTVSTESIVVLGALLLPRHNSDMAAFLLIGAFALGLVVYLIVMTMVFLRWTFSKLDPREADPPAWIAAGAVAIIVLAGSNLLASQATSEQLSRLAPFIEGVVVLAWATATFWFPLMIAIGVWRHVVNRVPLRYHPSYWALVFPLGMYGAATFRMATVLDLAALDWLPKINLAIALVAWTAAFAGLCLEGVRAVTATRRG